MKKQIETHFPIVVTNGCLQTVSEIEFGISEPEADKGGRCIIVAKEGADFEVENSTQKKIQFWAIEDCTFFSKDKEKRCDFAVFDDKTFAFAEIKRSKMKNRQQKRSEAVLQLSNILTVCKSKLDFQNYNLLAIKALTFQKSYPLARTGNQDAVLAFRNKFKAELLEGNSITFPFEDK